jgi:hypothetical protein
MRPQRLEHRIIGFGGATGKTNLGRICVDGIGHEMPRLFDESGRLVRNLIERRRISVMVFKNPIHRAAHPAAYTGGRIVIKVDASLGTKNEFQKFELPEVH